jgi:hypothetical protein
MPDPSLKHRTNSRPRFSTMAFPWGPTVASKFFTTTPWRSLALARPVTNWSVCHKLALLKSVSNSIKLVLT